MGRRLFLLLALALLTIQPSSAQVGGMLGGRGGGVFETTYLVATGNGINPDFDNTGLPNIPSSWGDTSLAVVIGAAPPTGAALRGRTYLNNRTGYIQRFELYVASSAMVNDGFVSIAVGKGISVLDFDDGSVPIAYYVRLTQTGAGLKLAISFPSDTGEQMFTWSGTVELQTAYELYIEHSVVFGRTVFRVNGEVVADYTHDGSAVQSIGTLVLGSSGGSTGRNIIYLFDRVLETPLAAGGRLPTNMSVVSPVNGSTDQEVSATLICSTGTDVDTYEVRYETVNPPVGAWTSLGTNKTLGPISLAHNTTYYVQCRGTNTHGTVTSAVSSFTTIAASSTGTHPLLFVTAARQTKWATMRADYLEDTTCVSQATVGERIACRLYKDVVDTANIAAGGRLENEGLEQALLSLITGENATARCSAAYSTAVATGLLHYSTSSAAANDGNAHRELFTDWVLVYDWCYQQWTQTQRDTYLTRLNGLATGMQAIYYTDANLRCSDVDQIIGDYFGIANLYYATKSYNPTAVAVWEHANTGGLVSSTLVCTPITHAAKTARNMIGYYYSDTSGPSVGGSWFQGTEYGSEAWLGYIGCEALRTTDAGDAACTEIDAFLDDWAKYYTHRLTRDYQNIYQFADNQEPHTAWMPYVNNHETSHYLTMSALLPEGATRQQMWRQFLNFLATNGTGQVFPLVYPSRGLMLSDPYITPAADLTGLSNCYDSTGDGVYTWNDGWTGVASNATQFVVQMKPQVRGSDHYIAWWGDLFLYRKGQYALTHPFSYAGVPGLMPEGTNTVALEGLDPAPGRLAFLGPQYKQVNGYTCGSDYMYVAGTTGGSYNPVKDFDDQLIISNPPEHYVDEYTRSVVYLSSATKTYDSVYVLDRMAVKDPQTLARYTTYLSNTCYPTTCFTSPQGYGTAQQQRIAAYPRWSSFLFQWTTTTPTVSGNTTTWTMPDGQIVQDDWLTPDAVTLTVVNTDTLPPFTANSTISVSERGRHRSVIEPVTGADWTVAARVITARDATAAAPVHTELSVTGTCIATLISRTGNNDVIIVNNSAQGDLIGVQNPTAAQAAAVLATSRYHKAKTCTIPWTQTTATAKVISLDMNPTGITWTSNLDGAGAVAATPNATGLKEIAVSGTGAHSLVLTGS